MATDTGVPCDFGLEFGLPWSTKCLKGSVLDSG